MDSSNSLTYPRRLFLWLLGYSALLVGCFIIFQYNREREFKSGEMNTRLQTINTYILTELEQGKDISQISLRDFHPFDDIRVSVISDEGRVVYDNSIDVLPGKNHLDREEIRSALAGGSGYTVRRHSESTGNYYFYSATRGDNGYIVRTAVPYSISLSALLKPDISFLWIMGVVTLAMCMLGYFATRRVGQHVTRLKKFADDVEKGTKISDTEPFPNDELGSISNNIVRLYARLQQANTEREREHKAALYEQREKERIKKQLTNNINHELKTPVASIKICVETLLAHPEMDSAKHDRFLQRCLTDADRLQKLLKDVALITRMDEGAAAIVKEDTDLSAIIRAVADDRRIVADSREIAIVNDVKGPLEMSGNPSLLEAIFSNLIDNAIAYSVSLTLQFPSIQTD
jgi:two-component system OmpR family sensor kinase